MYEGSLCVCCMSTENLMQLFVSGDENGELENYAEMLALCLRIPLSESDGHGSICTVCVSKLKDCICFKKRALKSISILTSVDLSELLPVEELQVLGLTQTEKSNRLEQQYETEMDSEYNIITTTDKTKKEAKKKVIGIKMSPSCSKIAVIQDSEDTQVGRDAMLVCQRGKRAVGRPRVHSPALPYLLRPDELDCRECHQAFPNHITLKVHYNSHFGRHACAHEGCHKRFMTRASLRKHAAAHRAGPFPCDHCQQEFSKLNTLLSHKRLKHGAVPPYRCGECGARFRTAMRRRRHLAAAHAHTERRYVCKYCDKKFLDSGSRAKHVSSLHEVVRVPCGVCGATVRRSALAQHTRRHDPPPPAPATPAPPAPAALKPAPERRFLCLLCGAAFRHKHRLQYHAGAHVRRGQFAGAPARLLADTRRRPRAEQRYGLLSDIDEDIDEQHSRAFSDDPPTPDDDPPTPDDDDDEVLIRAEDVEREILQLEQDDIYLDLDFSIPSDFDD